MLDLLLLSCLLLIGIAFFCFYSAYHDVVWMTAPYDAQAYRIRKTHANTDVDAANALARLNERNEKLIHYLRQHRHAYPSQAKVIQRLERHYSRHRIQEAVVEPHSTSYSINKEEIHYCLRTRDAEERVYDDNLLFYVSLHEMAHLASIEKEEHGKEFAENFMFLTGIAIKAGLYQHIDFKKQPVNYCGLLLKT